MGWTVAGLVGLGMSFYHAGRWGAAGVAGLVALLIAGHLHSLAREAELESALKGVDKRIETLEACSRVLTDHMSKTTDKAAVSPLSTTDRRRAH